MEAVIEPFVEEEQEIPSLSKTFGKTWQRETEKRKMLFRSYIASVSDE